MPGRKREPSFQLASGTTAERDGSYNLTTLGSIFYNTDTSNVEIRHQSPSNNAAWRDLVVNNKEQIDISGKLGINAGSLPTTTGEINLLTLNSDVGNQSYLEFKNIRDETGSDWNSSALRIQKKIDITPMGYIEFADRNVMLGTDNGEKLRILQYGNVGIGTGNPSEKLEVDGNIKSTGNLNVGPEGVTEVLLAGAGALNGTGGLLGTATAKSYFGAGTVYDAPAAFNNSLTQYDSWHSKTINSGSGTQGMPQYIEFEFPYDVIITKYKIWPRFGQPKNPKAWTLEGKTLGGIYNEIDDQSNITGWSTTNANSIATNANMKEFSLSTNTTAYRKFKLNVTESGANYVTIGELAFYGYPSTHITASSIASPSIGATHITAVSIGATDKLGIGNTTSDVPFTINSTTTKSINGTTRTMFCKWFRGNGSWYIGTENDDNANHNLYWFANTTESNTPLKLVIVFENDQSKGTSVNANTFTGQHRNIVKNVNPVNIESYIGLIVTADNNENIKVNGGVERGLHAITINETIPYVSVTNKSYDKKVFGVISGSEDPENRSDLYGRVRSMFTKEDGDDRIFINSLGEGAMWISNQNGSLESGDYVTSSNIPGYGMKQSSEFLANYTVAKMTMDCDFQETPRIKYKIKTEFKTVNYFRNTSDVSTNTSDVSTNTIDISTNTIDISTNTSDQDFITEKKYNLLDDETKQKYTLEQYDEHVNVLDENGQIQWEDSGETEAPYKVRYLLPDRTQISEEEYNTRALANEEVYKAAFVGCTYHCG